MDYLRDYAHLIEYFQEKFRIESSFKGLGRELVIGTPIENFIHQFCVIKNIKPCMHAAAQYRHDVFSKILDFNFFNPIVPILRLFPELREILFENAAFNV